jgi:O-antigen/teichoic acid export membrane protein
MMRSPKQRRRVAVGVADQVAYSLSNFLLSIFVASQSSVVEFGIFSLAYASFLVVLSLNRGLTGDPVLILASGTEGVPAQERIVRVSFGMSAMLGTGTACLLLLLGAATKGQPLASSVLFGFSVVCFSFFVQDFLRHAAFARGRPGVALISDSTVLAVEIFLFVILVSSGQPTIFLLIVGFGLAGIAGSLAFLVCMPIKPLFRRGGGCFPRRMRFKLCLDHVSTQLSQQGVIFWIGALAGVSASGGFRAAQTIFLPPATLMSGVQAALMPELVRSAQSSPGSYRRVVSLAALMMTLVAASYFSFAFLFSPIVGPLLFGESWGLAQQLIVFLGVASVASAVTNVSVIGLRAIGETGRALAARYAGILITHGSLFPALLMFGLEGAGWALAVAGPLQACIWWFLFSRSARRNFGIQS